MTAAANMRAISYDLSLEYTAICHVHGCLMEHDECRGTTKFPVVGQNLAEQIRTLQTVVTQADVDILHTDS